MIRPTIFILSFLISISAISQEIEGTRSFSMSGAFSAVASTNDAIFINAAGISQYPNRYIVELFHRYKHTDGFNVSTLSILDTTTSFPLGAGLAFSYMWGEDEKIEKQGYRIDLAFSYPFSQKLLWGFDVKYVRLDIGDRENAINAATPDMGLIYVITKWARASLYGQNLIYVGREELPLRSGAGLMIGNESSLYFAEDASITFYKSGEKKVIESVGANLFLSELLSLSAGYSYDQTRRNEHHISLGLGLLSRTAALELAYRQAVQDKDDYSITGSIRFYME